jgi:hypothetical protein
MKKFLFEFRKNISFSSDNLVIRFVQINFLIALNLVFLFGGTYIASLVIPDWQDIAESMTRMTMFFPALIIYYVFLVLFGKNIDPEKNKQKF